MSGRFVEVPHGALPDETLAALLEAFVTRQGYDTTDTSGAGMHGWVNQLKTQLVSGELIIIHDLQTESTEVMTQAQWRSFEQGLDDTE